MARWLLDSGLNIPVISGGIHSTLSPSEVIQCPGINMVCVGEGEIQLAILAGAIERGEDYRAIQGIWVNDDGNIIENGVCPLITDLDKLPYPDRGLFDYSNLEHERTGVAVFMASRGCPYLCTYCANHQIKETLCPDNPAAYVRFRSVDNVLDEIEKTLNLYPFIKGLHFDDDLFFLKRKWAEEFAEKYSARFKLPFTCNMRPNHISAVTARLLRKAGCTQVKIGLESGNDWIRNSVLDRKLTDRQIFDAITLCRGEGIMVHTFNMLGFPYETMATMLDTVKMNAKCKSDIMQVSIFYPFPKSKIHETCTEAGATVENEGYDFFSPMLNLPTLSQRKIYLFQRNFKFIVMVYSLIYRMGGQQSSLCEKTADKLFSSPFLNGFGSVLDALRKVKSFFGKTPPPDNRCVTTVTKGALPCHVNQKKT
jgi:radical SAM superfamily enzyme YgiQ (UPF0313 family)